MEAGENTQGKNTQGKGIFTTLKAYLDTGRIGEILILKGLITKQDLRKALSVQKDSNLQLGQILIRERIISQRQLATVLARQTFLRFVAGFMFFLFSFMGTNGKKARADTVRDIPSVIKVTNVSSISEEFARMAAYPALFGSAEKKSKNLKAFTKWTSMFDRFEQSMKTADAQKIMREWRENIEGFQGMDLKTMADKVNRMVNKEKYIIDSKNYGKSDYWATPVEFYSHGGDCEDFAIAKYAALRALGVPEERLRVAIIHDRKKNIPHAVLVVYTDTDAYILDNQVKEMKNARHINRYRPIFSINRNAWWLHTAPKTKTILASAD